MVLGVVGLRAFYKRQEPVSAKAAAQQTPQITGISLPASIKAAAVVAVPVPIEGKIELFQVEVGDEVYEGQMLATYAASPWTLSGKGPKRTISKQKTVFIVSNWRCPPRAWRPLCASADASRVRNDYLSQHRELTSARKFAGRRNTTPHIREGRERVSSA